MRSDPELERLLTDNGVNPQPFELEPPTVELAGDDGRFRWKSAQTEIWFTACHEHGEGVTGECSVTLREVVVHWAKLNLSTTRGRQEVAQKLERLDPAIDW